MSSITEVMYEIEVRLLLNLQTVSSVVILSQTRKTKPKQVDFLAKPDQTVSAQRKSGTPAAGRLQTSCGFGNCNICNFGSIGNQTIQSFA